MAFQSNPELTSTASLASQSALVPCLRLLSLEWQRAIISPARDLHGFWASELWPSHSCLANSLTAELSPQHNTWLFRHGV